MYKTAPSPPNQHQGAVSLLANFLGSQVYKISIALLYVLKSQIGTTSVNSAVKVHNYTKYSTQKVPTKIAFSKESRIFAL